MYWHLTLAAEERLTLFPTESQRRRAVRALVRVLGPAALLFFVADDHLHVVVCGTRELAGRLAQALALALRPIATAELDAARIRPVNGRAHLESLVPYVLDQATRHGLPGRPSDQIGSCFADLVGARVVGFSNRPLRDALPRLTSDDLFAAVKLPPILPVADLAGVPLPELVRAGGEAVAADVLAGKQPHLVQGRATVARLAVRAGYRREHVARALGTTPRSVQRLLAGPPVPQLDVAVRTRIALDRAIRGRTEVGG
jgi:hypothetical protein